MGGAQAGPPAIRHRCPKLCPHPSRPRDQVFVQPQHLHSLPRLKLESVKVEQKILFRCPTVSKDSSNCYFNMAYRICDLDVGKANLLRSCMMN